MNTKSTPPFDKRDLRNALGTFGTGVTVVTAGNALTRPVGVTANSFSSVSLEPPIVLWSLVATSPSLDVFDAIGRFVINILSLQQMDLSKQFASNLPNKFEGVDYALGLAGLPVLNACAATIECKTIQRSVIGDHVLFLGQVEKYSYESKPTLFFCQGSYLQGAECVTT